MHHILRIVSLPRSGLTMLSRLFPGVLGLILMLGTLWGLTVSIGKMAMVTGQIHPLEYTFWQSLICAAGLWCVCKFRQIKCVPNLQLLRHALACGVLSIALPNVLMMTSLHYISASLAALSVTATPMITYLLSVWFGLEKVSFLRIAGVIAGVFGVLVVILPAADVSTGGQSVWFLLSLAAAGCYGLNNIAATMLRPPGVHAMALALAMASMAALLVGIVMLVVVPYHYVPGRFLRLDMLVLAQGLLSCVAYCMFFEIIRRSGPVPAGYIGLVVTVAGIGWGVMLLGEQPGIRLLLAACLVMGGLVLVNKGKTGQDE
ncbi:MAG: DMT family transporter [Pseudomonadota bacterium]